MNILSSGEFFTTTADTGLLKRGHSGEEGNEGADQLAVAGATGRPVQERAWDTGDLGKSDGGAKGKVSMLASVEVEVSFREPVRVSMNAR